MPYRREFEPVLRRPIASQESVPSSAYWRQRALDFEDQAAQEDYEREMENWYLQNQGVVQPDGSYFGPEIGPRRTHDQFGTPISYQEIQDHPVGRAIDDLLLGYDPREGAEGYEPEYDDSELYDAALLGFVPGGRLGARAARKAGSAAFAGIVGKDVTDGRRLGALDLAFVGGLAGAGARRAKSAGQSFRRGYQQGRARRAYEEALRRNTLPQPKVRRQNARTGRWDEVNAYPEFAPYEEVRF